ncbi:hypothetical protein CVT26_009114, partial [Gymnopilus dilepis]
PRVHRLPRRTDFKLIPAPLDLSLPLATEKSPLPAIIVTPSSPSSTHDFSIAFLAPPPKPPIWQRILSFTPLSKSKVLSSTSATSPNFRLRSIIFVLIVFFILMCHLVFSHGLAMRSPHMDFAAAAQTGEVHVHPPASGVSIGWLDGLRNLFGRDISDGAMGQPYLL